MKKEPEYRKEGNEYAFYWEGDKLRFRCESVAIVGQVIGDGEGAFLRKHGPSDTVQKWFKQECQKFINAGDVETASALFLIDSDKWDVVELNKCINISGYVGIFIQKVPELESQGKGGLDLEDILDGFQEG